MPGNKVYVDNLAKVSLFSGMTKRELQRIAKAGVEVSRPAGSTIIEQGRIGREAFIILEGTATVRRNGKKVSTLAPGSIVGELSLLDRGTRSATVTCDTDCRLFVLEQRAFTAVLDDVPALSHKLLATLAGRMRELDRRSFG